MKVSLEYGQFGNFELVAEDGESILVQTDWDYPGVAMNLGWCPCPKCLNTDGTVDCKHKKAGEMIAEAAEFLDDHIGDIFEDPGYFDIH